MTLSELGSLCLCSYCLDARNRDRIRFPHSSVCCRQTNLIEKPLFQLGRRPIFTGSIPTVRAPICSRTTRATGTQARKSSRGSAALPFSAEFAGISLHPPGTLMVLRYGRRRFPSRSQECGLFYFELPKRLKRSVARRRPIEPACIIRSRFRSGR
jgi:hypothetical protein